MRQSPTSVDSTRWLVLFSLVMRAGAVLYLRCASALIPRALWLWCIIVNVSTEVRARFFERSSFLIFVGQYMWLPLRSVWLWCGDRARGFEILGLCDTWPDG